MYNYIELQNNNLQFEFQGGLESESSTDANVGAESPLSNGVSATLPPVPPRNAKIEWVYHKTI